MWQTSYEKGAVSALNKPILIEGLPGIGHVGKVAIDYIIDELKAKKLASFFSYSFPNSVFINESNLIELPSIEIYYKKMKTNDLLLLTGDLQPLDEESSYSFTELILELFQKFKGTQIITLGGVGLKEVPQSPKIFCTGNNKKIVGEYSNFGGLNTNLHGVIGPIIGVSGILLGMSAKKNIPAVALLIETLQHPLYLGVKEARELVKFLNKKLNLSLNLNNLDKEINQIEKEVIKRTKQLAEVQKAKQAQIEHSSKSYIG